MSLVKHSLLSIASTPSEVVKQVLASIESQEVFNSKESLGTLGICRVCIISSIGERQVRMKWTLGPFDALSGLVLF